MDGFYYATSADINAGVDVFAEIGEGAYTIAMINAKTIVTLDEPLYFYRVGQSSLSTNYNNIPWYKKNIEKQIKNSTYTITDLIKMRHDLANISELE